MTTAEPTVLESVAHAVLDDLLATCKWRITACALGDAIPGSLIDTSLAVRSDTHVRPTCDVDVESEAGLRNMFFGDPALAALCAAIEALCRHADTHLVYALRVSFVDDMVHVNFSYARGERGPRTTEHWRDSLCALAEQEYGHLKVPPVEILECHYMEGLKDTERARVRFVVPAPSAAALLRPSAEWLRDTSALIYATLKTSKPAGSGASRLLVYVCDRPGCESFQTNLRDCALSVTAHVSWV